MFSKRTSWNRTTNRLAGLVAERQRAGAPLLDLRNSNPTECGFRYPDEFYTALADQRSASYAPHPLGLPGAREAVGAYYEERGRAVVQAHTWLAASTSELYAHLLQLLCDPGEAVLVPRPGYPLLEYLCDLQQVEQVPYPLHYDGAWSLDRTALATVAAEYENIRALMLVSPNNPTGNFVSAEEWSFITAWAREREVALIVDEVFADYPLAREESCRLPPLQNDVIAFHLSGLSKVAALPQLKLSWGVASGPNEKVTEAMARLEIITDTFLSVNTPVQHALPAILEQADTVQEQVRERCRLNVAELGAALAGSSADLLKAEGGWSALVRLPQVGDMDDEAWAERLLEEGTWVQPGYLFDMDGTPPHIAVSLLTPTEAFREGCAKLRCVLA